MVDKILMTAAKILMIVEAFALAFLLTAWRRDRRKQNEN